MNNRNIQIDTLRGIACLLLVAFHVVGAQANVGLKIEAGLYRDINDILAYVRMPLFTFLSGIVYAYRPFSENVNGYIKGKFRRLIIPMLIVGTLFAVLQSVVPGTNSTDQNWWLLHIKPVAHFWFVESIFLVFLIMIPLEVLGLFRSKTSSIGIFCFFSALYILNIRFDYFSISGAMYLFPYFLLGMAMHRFSVTKLLNIKIGIALLAGVTLLLTLASIDALTISARRSTIGLIIGSMACIGLLAIKLKSEFLAKIGFFSYSIYIFHVFFTAGTRIFLKEFGVVNIEIVFALSLITGIVGPIVVEKICNGTNISRIAFLGKPSVKIDNLWLTKRLKLKH